MRWEVSYKRVPLLKQTADASLQEGGLPDMLWGELYAARQRHPLSLLWWRRDDVCELLLREGHAMLPDAEDFDWLQVSWLRHQAFRRRPECLDQACLLGL